MKITSLIRKVLLAIAAGFELLTGIALTLVPVVMTRALLGGEITGAGIGVARICGLAMLALGIACWPMPQPTLAALRALLIYNLLTTPYLAWQLVRGATAKGLAPALAVHAILAVLLALAYFSAERDERRLEKSEVVAPPPQTADNHGQEQKATSASA
jgi:multisubunit Na+/H+ antiporter MnhG subunit